MRRFRALIIRLTHSLTGRRRDAESDAEIADHIQRHTEDGIRDGLTPAEARRRAVVALGGIAQTTEGIHERRGIAFVDSLVQDVRFALRLFGKHKGFTTIAVLTLAVGLGTTTAVFTIGNRLVFGPIPGVVDPEQIVLFHTGYPSQRPGATTVSRISYPNYLDIAPRLTTIQIAGMQGYDLPVTPLNGHPRTEPVQFVTPSFFELLGVRMQVGTPFLAEDDNPSEPALVVVISDALWRSQFNRDPAIVGRTLTIAGHDVSILGVTEPGFRGPFRSSQDLLWLPGATYPIFTGVPSYVDRARGGYYEFLVRPKPDASLEQADAELNAFIPWLVQQYPGETRNLTTRGWAFRNLGSINRYRQDQLLPLIGAMAGIAGLVLILTCSNVAGLLLIRGVGRMDETGVRLALGAGRWRVMRQHLTEGVVLWFFGAVVGGGIVWLICRSISGTDIVFLRMRDARLTFDWRVGGFAALTSLVIGLLFSALPAWRAVRAQAWTPSSHGSTQRPSRVKTGTALVATQLAASLTLLLGALLLTATVRHLKSVDVGVDSPHLTAVRLNTREVLRENGVRWQYYQAMSERARALPGVEMITLSEAAPVAFGGTSLVMDLRPTDATREAVETRVIRVLAPDFFETLGIPLRVGRTFDELELLRPPDQGAPVVILSESLARALFGTLDIVGRYVQDPRFALRREIIGVAGDVRLARLTGDPDFVVYTPRVVSSAAPSDLVPSDPLLIIRSATGRDLSSEIRAAGRIINAAVPLDAILSFDQALARTRMEWDVLAWLLTVFSIIACGLAALGVYGILAFAVASRQRELGIRMALGASTVRIGSLIAAGVVPMLLGGLLLGSAGGAGLAQVLRSRLVGVEPFDPAAWLLAALGLILVTVAAALLPARRAIRVNVAEALRSL